MQKNKADILKGKLGLHPRNLHKGPYDFNLLQESCDGLSQYVKPNAYGNLSIDFANPEAVKMLNKALLKHFYGIGAWDIPANYLCPPIPGRADYIHYMADLLKESNNNHLPPGNEVHVLDTGTGANCIYPILGHMTYQWNFVGSDIDPIAIRNAKEIILNNESLQGRIECRLQLASKNIFRNIIKPNEFFDLTICNPPFHSSPEEALEGTQRKWKNLGYGKKERNNLNFGGSNKELWCEGGESAFISNMITESSPLGKQCFWFSTLVSKSEKLPAIYNALDKLKVKDIRTIEMSQGQKISRVVAWTFLDPKEQEEWRKSRWKKQETP